MCLDYFQTKSLIFTNALSLMDKSNPCMGNCPSVHKATIDLAWHLLLLKVLEHIHQVASFGFILEEKSKWVLQKGTWVDGSAIFSENWWGMW